MRELNSSEIELVTGGILPIVVAAAKGFSVGFSLGAMAYGLYLASK